MKCCIQWIDKQGNPTPDTNDATHYAHVHETVWRHPDGNPTNRIIGYSEKIRESFPICAEHMKRITYDMYYPIGGWSFSLIEPPPNA